jgi:hypothetical protein
MQLQDQTRRADQFDWERANMRPLQLRAANRVEDYNQYADPFMRNQLRGADYDADIIRAGNFGLRTGNYAPAMNTDFNYFVPQASYFRPEVSFYQDPSGMGFTTPDGGRAPLQFDFQNYADANRLLNPALAGYDQYLATLMSNNNQFDATLQQNAVQQANSMAWLNWQQQQAMGGASPGSAFGLGGFNGF